MPSQVCQKCPDCGGGRLPGVAVGGRQTGRRPRTRPPPPASTPRGSTSSAQRSSGPSPTRSCRAPSCWSAAATRSLYQKAFGHRAVAPAAEPMTLDTIFDLASLTKVVATTTSVMKLVEEGRIRLNDRGRRVHSGVRALRQGRHHHPPPDDAHVRPAARPRSRRRVDRRRQGDRARDRGSADRRRPGERFVYSDINYFLLGDIVRRVSGQPLDRVRARHGSSSRSA